MALVVDPFASEVADEQPQVPRLRTDILLNASNDGDEAYVLEDPIAGRFYRVGLREYTLASQLDGQQSIDHVLTRANRQLPGHAIDPVQAKQIVDWLRQHGLLEEVGIEALSRAQNERDRHQKLRRSKWANPIFIRIPLINPDPLLGRALPYVNWMLGAPFFAIWVLVVASGAYHVAAHWDQFRASSAGIIYPHNWFWLGVAWVVIKTIHELFHGLVSKRHGGHVFEAGVILILFLPIGYVDATSAWRFDNRWHRAHTAAAGMFIELLIAGCAAWVWTHIAPGPISDLAFNAMLIAGVSTVLFNANPLMRFDGYFILSDIVNIPNLYGRGRSYVQYLASRYVAGTPAHFPVKSWRKGLFVKAYGLASMLWRLLVLFTILVAASSLFHGAGIALAAVAAVMMIGRPLWRAGAALKAIADNQEERRYAPYLRVSVILLGLAAFAVWVPWTKSVTAPAVVEYANLIQVRAETAGFVSDLFVELGDAVTTGTPLLQMNNPDLAAEQRLVTAQLAASVARARSHLARARQAAYQIERHNQQTLKERLADIEERLKALLVIAQGPGTVITPGLPSLVGSYQPLGAALVAIGDERRKELLISVDQIDVGDVKPLLDQSVRVRILGRPGKEWAARILRAEPKASLSVRSPMLAAINGGPIAVRHRTSRANAEAEEFGYEFLSPRFSVIGTLTSEDALTLKAGERARVRLPIHPRSVGRQAYLTMERWINRLFETYRQR